MPVKLSTRAAWAAGSSLSPPTQETGARRPGSTACVRTAGPPSCHDRPTGRGIGCPPADVGEVRRWRTGPASPGPGEPIAEDLDRVENEVDEIRRNGKPCAACGAGTRITAAWRISERLAKRLGLLEPRFLVVVVAACPGCSAAAGAGPRLESRLLRRWRRAFRSTPG